MGRLDIVLALLVLGLYLPQNLWAFRAGDSAEELKIDYISNGPVELTAQNDDAKKLKILVICRTEGSSSQGLLPYLNELQTRFKDIEIVAVTADPKNKAEEFFKSMPNPKFATAIDKNGSNIRRYMAGSMIYPMTFVVDNQGDIIWNGESLDLIEMLENFYAGNFDAAKAKKISPLLDELQSRMRSGEERMADYTLRKILSIDPYNAPALRLRIFMLESSNKSVAAWNLVAEQLKKHPKHGKFYLMQLDLAMRYSEFYSQVGVLTKMYLKNIPPNSGDDTTLAWTLLNRMPLNATVLEEVGELIKRLNPTGNTLECAEMLKVKALYASRKGHLSEAIQLEQEAISILEKVAPHRLESANELLKFYKSASSSN